MPCGFSPVADIYGDIKRIAAVGDAEDHVKLEALLGRLRLTDRVRALAPGRDAHDALYDAIGSAALLEHIFALPGWRDAPLDTLMQAQAPRLGLTPGAGATPSAASHLNRYSSPFSLIV